MFISKRRPEAAEREFLRVVRKENLYSNSALLDEYCAHSVDHFHGGTIINAEISFTM